MNKKRIALFGLVSAAVLTIGCLIPNTRNVLIADTEPQFLDCDYMRANYTPLSEVISSCQSQGVHEIEQTWGTITAIYTQSSYYHAYVQSGNAAVCLYKAEMTSKDQPFSIGDVVTMRGTPTYYNGMYEFDISGDCYYDVLTDVKGYDVDLYHPTAAELTATSGSTQWNENLLKGLVKVELKNLTVKAACASNKVTCIGDGYEIEMFWGNIGGKSYIASAFNSALNNNTIDVIGYMNTYAGGSSPKMQIMIRSADDVKANVPVGPIAVTSIDIDGFIPTELFVDDYVELRATVSPSNATNKNIIWSSTNELVAEISDSNTLHAVSEGYATITATSESDPSISDSFTVLVKRVNYTDYFNLDTSYGTFQEIDDNSYFAELTYSEESGCSAEFNISCDLTANLDVQYEILSLDTNTICNESQVELYLESDYQNNVVLFHESGNFIIQVYEFNTGLGFTLTFNVVEAPALKDISLDSTSASIAVGETFTVNVAPIPSTEELKYSVVSEDTTIATVNKYSNKFIVRGVKAGTTYIEVSVPSGPVHYFEVTVTGGATENTKTIDFSDISTATFASNFGYSTIDSVKYGYYRAKSKSSYWAFYPSANLISGDPVSLPGSFYNDQATYGVTSLEITYRGAGTVSYGDSKTSLTSSTLASESSYTTVKISTNDSYYWYVEANNVELDIKTIVITYNSEKEFSGSYSAASRNDIRIPATTYTGTLIDGVSYVDVPTSVSISGNNYTVLSTKRYTYYSFSYVQAHASELDLSEIALTDPVDVANYYIAFKCAPVNYGSKNTVTAIENDDIGSISEVVSLFDDDARCAQQFNRTDGYAIGIPYIGSKPIYLEFDFASNSSYSTSSRDVSRIVLWTGGWTGYESAPVATFTDDHYVTFREYNNYGGWNEPFDSIQNGSYTSYRTGYNYGSTTTLSRA